MSKLMSYYCSTAAIGSIVSQEVELATTAVEITSNPAYETVTSSKIETHL